MDIRQFDAFRWYVLRCKPQKEASLVRILNMRDFAACVPTVQRERRRIRGNVAKIIRWRVPVMPGYVLTGFPGEGHIPWYSILALHLVNSVLSENGRFRQIPFSCISHMVDQADSIRIGASKYMRVWNEYNPGDTVRIDAGPFYGHEGKVGDVSETEARVFLNVLGRETPVTIAVSDASKVQSTKERQAA